MTTTPPAPGPPPDGAGYPDPHRAPGWDAPVADTAVRGRRRTVTLVALGSVLVVAGVATAVVAWTGHRATSPLPAAVGSSTEAHVRQLVLGSCVGELPEDGTVTHVEVVPCGDPHEAQVVARTDWSDDVVWPGADGVLSKASKVCTPGTLTADGVDPADFRLVLWTPSEVSWADGDRTALCLAAGDGGRGTLLGTR